MTLPAIFGADFLNTDIYEMRWKWFWRTGATILIEIRERALSSISLCDIEKANRRPERREPRQHSHKDSVATPDHNPLRVDAPINNASLPDENISMRNL
jgi:hypothetical protein